MSNNVIEFRSAHAYRVIVEGIETGKYDAYDAAMQDAYAAAVARPDLIVEVVGGAGLRIVVRQPPPVDPEEPVDPDPEIPVDPEE